MIARCAKGTKPINMYAALLFQEIDYVNSFLKKSILSMFSRHVFARLASKTGAASLVRVYYIFFPNMILGRR